MIRLMVGLRAVRSAGAAAWPVFRAAWRGDAAEIVGPCEVTMACSHGDVLWVRIADGWRCRGCGLMIGSGGVRSLD